MAQILRDLDSALTGDASSSLRRVQRQLEAGQPRGQKRLKLSGLGRCQLVDEAPFIAHVLGECLIDQLPSGCGERDYPAAAVAIGGSPRDEPLAFEAVDALGHRARRDHRERRELAGSSLERLTRTPQSGQDVEFSLAEPIALVDQAQLAGEQAREAMQSPDHPLRAHIKLGALACPFPLYAGDMIKRFAHGSMIASTEANIASMEAINRWSLVTATAPVAWGANYYVTRQFLPAHLPLYGAAIRALPAGLLLLALCRSRPRGSWWWRSLVLGMLNVAAFFVLIYLAAQLLPTNVASTLMATSPLAIMLLAWALLAERPHRLHLAGAGIGITGVCLMLFTGATSFDSLGILASIAAMTMSSLGYVLAKRWSGDIDVLASTSWQLIAGGLILLPLAAVLEGAPPAFDETAILGFGYVTIIATALAFTAWFAGLRHLPAATVGLIGLLNPVTGVLLGTLVAAETLTVQQLCGVLLALGGISLGQHITARLARGPGAPSPRAALAGANAMGGPEDRTRRGAP